LRPITSLLFDDRDAYAAAIRAGCRSELLAVDVGAFEARLTRLDLCGVQLLAGWERRGRIAFLDVTPETVLIALPSVPRTALLWAGVPVGADEMLIVGPGNAVHARAANACQWGEIRIARHTLARYGRAVRGASFRLPRGICVWRPSQPTFDVLTRLHRAAVRSAQSRPEGPLVPEALHGQQQEFIEAIIDCLSDGTPVSRPSGSDLMARFEHLCQANGNRVLRLAEVVAVLGTREKTLHTQCRLHLGMGPLAYMQLHRLHRAWRALRSAHPANTTIAQIARSQGFTEPGRFASRYRALFGELPSATLRDGRR
jgi:AraC family transcriptional regulator, ethanolamine operon transcriptional activator